MTSPADASVIVKGQQLLSAHVYWQAAGWSVAAVVYIWLMLRGVWKQRDESKFTWSSRAARRDNGISPTGK